MRVILEELTGSINTAVEPIPPDTMYHLLNMVVNERCNIDPSYWERMNLVLMAFTM